MKRSRGFTIVEFMVAMTVGLIMLAAVLAIFFSTRQNYRGQEANARLQENARFGLVAMEHDLREAGLRGCVGAHAGLSANGSTFSRIVNTAPNPAAYADNFGVAVQGFEGIPGGFSPALDPALAALSPPPDPGSDIVTVRGASAAGIPVSTAMANSLDSVTVASGASITQGERLMLSNCTRSTVFVASSASGSNVLLHDLSHNSSLDLGWAFGQDAIVLPLETTTYYVGASSVGAGIAGGLSLYRVRGNAAPEELVEGVQQMKIGFGESLTGIGDDGNVSVERYVAAGAVSDWDSVVSVRIGMLFRSEETNVTPSPQTYQFDGASATADDLRLRRVYQTTVGIRNRTK